MAFLAAIGLAASLAQGLMARDDKKDAERASQMLAKREAREREAAQQEAKAQYEEEKRFYRPIKERLASAAVSKVPEGYDRLVGNVMGDSAEAERRGLAVGPGGAFSGSGLTGGAIQGRQVATMSALENAKQRAKARQNEVAIRVASMEKSAPMGQQMISEMNRGADYYGRQAASAGQQAGQYGQMEQQGYTDAVKSGIGLAGELMNKSEQAQSPAGLNPWGSPSTDFGRGYGFKETEFDNYARNMSKPGWR